MIHGELHHGLSYHHCQSSVSGQISPFILLLICKSICYPDIGVHHSPTQTCSSASYRREFRSPGQWTGLGALAGSGDWEGGEWGKGHLGKRRPLVASHLQCRRILDKRTKGKWFTCKQRSENHLGRSASKVSVQGQGYAYLRSKTTDWELQDYKILLRVQHAKRSA